jgi:hypothetical protein
MGFMAEFSLHRFVCRGKILDALLGSCESLKAEMGAQLIAQRAVLRFPAL